jgi:hypothetical protein
MPSKKEMRRLAIEHEKQRRYAQALQACPISRADYEQLVDSVSDQLVEHGHSQDMRLATAWLKSEGHPVEAVTAFLTDRNIADDWSLLVSGDSCRLFGPSAERCARMPLARPELERLLEWLDGQVQDLGCDHTHRLTRIWLRDHGKPETRILGALMAQGGFCDCEVVLNIEPDAIYPVKNSESGPRE